MQAEVELAGLRRDNILVDISWLRARVNDGTNISFQETMTNLIQGQSGTPGHR